MKKLIVFLILTSIIIPAFSQTKSNLTSVEENSARISSLLDESLWKNSSEIFNLSQSVPLDLRISLYDKYEQKAVKTFLWNLIPYMGIGSFLAHDNFGGFLELGCAVIGVSLIALASPQIRYTLTTSKTYTNDVQTTTNYTYNEAYAVAGEIIAFSGWIFGLIRPWVYTSKYNNYLKSALRVNDSSKIEVSFLPQINPIEKQIGLMASIKF